MYKFNRQVFERYLTLDEERRLLRTVGKYADAFARRDAAWMLLLRHTGIRVGALAGLTVLDALLALKSGRLRSRPEVSKQGRGYEVYLNRKAQAALTTLLRIRREQGHAENPDAPLIMSRKRQAMSVRSFQARMQYWVALAGLHVAASPHWWRHTLSKRLIKQSIAQDPIAIVQSALGHASRNSTAIYTLPDREEIARAMEAAA